MLFTSISIKWSLGITKKLHWIIKITPVNRWTCEHTDGRSHFFSKLSLKIVLCNGALRHTAEAWWGTNWPRLAEWWGTNRPRLAEWVPGLLSLVPFPQFRSRTLYIEVRHRLIWRLTLRNFKMADKLSNQIPQSDPIFLSLNLVNLFSHFYQLI